MQPAVGQPALGSIEVAAGPDLQWAECSPSPWQLQLWRLEESIEQKLQAGDQKLGSVMLQVQRDLRQEREELERAIAELREDRETAIVAGARTHDASVVELREGLRASSEHCERQLGFCSERMKSLHEAYEAQESRTARLDEAVRKLEGQLRAVSSCMDAEVVATKRAAQSEGKTIGSGDLGAGPSEMVPGDRDKLASQFLELQDLVLNAVADQVEAQITELHEVFRHEFSEISQKVEGAFKSLNAQMAELWANQSQVTNNMSVRVPRVTEGGQDAPKPPLSGESTPTTATTLWSAESMGVYTRSEQTSRGGSRPHEDGADTKTVSAKKGPRVGASDGALRMADALRALRQPLPT